MKKLKIENNIDFESLMERIEIDGESVTLVDKDGTPVAVIMPYDDYDDLKDAKDKNADF